MTHNTKIYIELIEFIGNYESLVEIKNKIISSKKGKNKLSYELIEPFIPEENDEQTYRKLKCDELGLSYTNFLFANQKNSKFKQANDRIHDYLNKHGYLGLRNQYVNLQLSVLKTTLTQESLTIRFLNTAPFPIDFFKFVAKKYNVNFFSIEKQYPRFLLTAYNSKNEKSESQKLTLDLILNNENIQEKLIKYDVYNQSDLAFAYFLNNNIDNFSNIIKDNKLSLNNILDAVEEDYSKYSDSFFYELSFHKQINKTFFLEKTKKQIQEIYKNISLQHTLDNNIQPKKISRQIYKI